MMSVHDICNASPEKPATRLQKSLTSLEKPTQEEEPNVAIKAKRVRSTDLESLGKHEAKHAEVISKNTTPFTLKQEVAHQNKITAVLEKITKLKEKAAASEEKLSTAAKTAGGSGHGARCTWTDKQTRQLIAARSINDHFFGLKSVKIFLIHVG